MARIFFLFPFATWSFQSVHVIVCLFLSAVFNPLLQEAHEILRLHTSSPVFVDAVRGDARITAVLGASRLEELLNPATYIGLAPEVIDDIVREYGVGAPVPAASVSS